VLLSWASAGRALELDHSTLLWCVLGALTALALGITALLTCRLRCGPAGATVVGCLVGGLAGAASAPVLALLSLTHSGPPTPVGLAVLGAVFIGWVGSIMPSWFGDLRALLGD
jgi:hypothetical protein